MAKRIKNLMKELELDCNIFKNKNLGFTVLCFSKLPRKRELCRIQKEFKKAGYESVCGFKTLNLVCKKREKWKLKN